MRKVEMIEKISKETGVEKVDVLVILETLFNEVKETVISGEEVSFHGFGTFRPIIRAEKRGRIISTGVDIVIPRHYEPKFFPSKTFKALLRPDENDIE